MTVINEIILRGLRDYINENSDIPKEMGELVKKLLEVEKMAHYYSTKGGIDKLYDQVLQKFTDKDELIAWSKEYDK